MLKFGGLLWSINLTLLYIIISREVDEFEQYHGNCSDLILAITVRNQIIHLL